MSAKLLLDENLSPRIAQALRAEGVDVVHVRDRKGLGKSDSAVLDRAYQEDRVLVTANVGDFDRLARATELHAGIVFVEDGSLLYDEQLRVMRAVVEVLQGEDMVNRILRTNLDGKIEFENVP